MTDRMLDVQGRCPACGWASLFLGNGGHVTCSRLECPNPSAADDLLHGEPGLAATQATEPEEGQHDLLPPIDPEPSDPTQCSGEEGFCPEHGFHRHSLKRPGEARCEGCGHHDGEGCGCPPHPSSRAGLHDAIVGVLGQIPVIPPVAHRRAQADNVLALLYREWPRLRAETEAEDAAVEPQPRGWTPPPPGSTREQLPPALLALINLPDYVSTACQTALHLEAGPAPTPTGSGAIPDVGWYVDRLHARCRKNQKFTGQLCICRCHTEEQPGPA